MAAQDRAWGFGMTGSADDSDAELIHAIEHAVGSSSIQHAPEVVESYRRDSALLPPAGIPSCVVTARSTEDVAAVVKVARQHGRPVVTRGAGSGLTGGANAIDGCVLLSLTAMDEIIRLDPGDQVVVTQPGVLTGALKSAAAHYGLQYPPDPASAEFSTIGGNIATNAGGLCCVRYGVTSDYVLGLEVVLADGSITRVGRGTVKGVAGYDLTRLLVGSEGTLGIITEATLRLVPRAVTRRTVVAGFAATHDTARAVLRLSSDGAWPSLIEVMDRTTIVAVNRWKGLDIPEVAALLLVQCEGLEATASHEAAIVREACEAAGSAFTYMAEDEDESDQLLEARRLAYPALERLGNTLLDDVAVPRTRVPELIDRINDIASTHGVHIGTFGHAGDGNLHPTIIYEDEELVAARAAFDDIVATAIDLGGTVAGEHGIGLLKVSHLASELSHEARVLQQRIKHAFDPEGVLNPGKAVAFLPRD
jgi:glycolate oxidase